MLRMVSRMLPAVFLAAGLCGCGSRTAPAEAAPEPVVAQIPAKAQPTPVAEKKLKRKQAVTAPAPEKKKPLVVGPKVTAAPDSPALPQDRADKLVADLLRPNEDVFTRPWAQAKLPAGLRSLEQPALLLPPFTAQVRRARLADASRPALPRPLPEQLPFVWTPTDDRLPARVLLPAGPLVRVAGPDVNQPPPLPILATPQSDRAGAADPTADASRDAVLGELNPTRLGPAPFDRPAIPDPFENRRTIRLRTALPEPIPQPQLLPPTPPKSLPEK
jgi:hypothetical protein